MNRCPSEYRTWTARGQYGEILHCTRNEGHSTTAKNQDMHHWLGSGHKVMWPDSAALSPVAKPDAEGGGVSP